MLGVEEIMSMEGHSGEQVREALEGRMGLNRLRKLVRSTGKRKEEQMSGGEQ